MHSPRLVRLTLAGAGQAGTDRGWSGYHSPGRLEVGPADTDDNACSCERLCDLLRSKPPPVGKQQVLQHATEAAAGKSLLASVLLKLGRPREVLQLLPAARQQVLCGFGAAHALVAEIDCHLRQAAAALVPP